MEKYLMHYGVQGQKWGKRNYQYEDGSLTPEGRIHYGVGQKRYSRKLAKEMVEYKAREKRKHHDKEYNRKSSEIESHRSRAYKIAEKYGLDEDDFGGGDDFRFSERELRIASSRALVLLR